jgi:predicted metal-dependent phosphoesterase TrpH
MLDLHVHSTFSDGSETPEHICELAHEAGISTIALTDHDGLGGVEAAAKRASDLGLGFVPGCEVSCSWASGSLHMLCYFVEPGDGPLQEELERLAGDRAERNELMVAKLAGLGLPITYEEVLEEAGGKGVGRPHFAAVLVKHGVVTTVQEAFDTLLAKGAPGYVNKARVEAGEIIASAKASGAVAVLAHPHTLGLEPPELASAVEELAELGLGGLECLYGRYEPERRAALAALAQRNGLAVTGGSDYHGAYKPDLALGVGQGDLDVPDGVLDELEARRPGF